MRNKFLEELKLAAFRKKKQASSFFFSQFALSLQTQKRGVMLEWLKRHAWKACIRQKRIASSNLAHSAKTVCYTTARCFFIFRILKNHQWLKRKKRVSRNLVGINFRHPNVMPNFAVWKTITYRHWHRWCCQPRF